MHGSCCLLLLLPCRLKKRVTKMGSQKQTLHKPLAGDERAEYAISPAPSPPSLRCPPLLPPSPSSLRCLPTLLASLNSPPLPPLLPASPPPPQPNSPRIPFCLLLLARRMCALSPCRAVFRFACRPRAFAVALHTRPTRGLRWARMRHVDGRVRAWEQRYALVHLVRPPGP